MIEPETGLVTAAALTKAAGPAYGSGELLAALTAAGHTPVIKPMPLGRAVPDGFTIDEFPLLIHPRDRLRREHRAKAADPGFQADYRRHRPMVERSIAWMTRGARRVPYRGVTKNHAWWLTRAAAINLKRLLNLGLTNHEGAWALG